MQLNKENNRMDLPKKVAFDENNKNDQRKNRKRKNIKWIIVILIFFGLGFGAGIFFESKSEKLINKDLIGTKSGSYQEGWDAARRRLKETNLYTDIGEVNLVSGEVQSVNDDKISLKIQPLEPLADPDLDVRIIEIDDNTRIYKQVQKDQEQYKKEMDEFNDKLNNPNLNLEETIMPPELFIKKEADKNEIKEGSVIMIESATDFKNLKNVKATEIVIQENVALNDAIPIPAPDPMVNDNTSSENSNTSPATINPVPVSITESENEEGFEISTEEVNAPSPATLE